jgi:hypothetical protein
MRTMNLFSTTRRYHLLRARLDLIQKLSCTLVTCKPRVGYCKVGGCTAVGFRNKRSSSERKPCSSACLQAFKLANHVHAVLVSGVVTINCIAGAQTSCSLIAASRRPHCSGQDNNWIPFELRRCISGSHLHSYYTSSAKQLYHIVGNVLSESRNSKQHDHASKVALR